MAEIAPGQGPDGLAGPAQLVYRHYRSQVVTRRIYTAITLVVFLAILVMALKFANDANSGKFFERLPYFFDFLRSFVPEDPFEIVRAMFDLPSPYYDGSLKHDYVFSHIGRPYDPKR